MFPYLKKDIENRFVEFPEKLDENYAQGTSYDDYLAGMWILLSEGQLSFKNENPSASPKEIINMAFDPIPDPTPEELLSRAKGSKFDELNRYDFRKIYLDGTDAWTSDKLTVKDNCDRSDTVEFAGSIYPSSHVRLFVDKQSNYEDMCGSVYKTLYTAIEEADTVEAVESVEIKGFPEVINMTNAELEAEVKEKTESSVEYQAVMFSRMMINTPTMAASILPSDALRVKKLYPVWGEYGAEMGKEVTPGFRFNHGEDLYEVVLQHTLSSEWAPGVGTDNLYKVVQEEHSGTMDDPIPWKYNMVLEKDKYYIDKGAKYVCVRDSINPMPYANLSDLVNGGFVVLIN